MKKNVKVLFFCVLCMVFPKVGIVNSAVVNSSKPSSLNSGLVGYWTFDGKDMIPNVRDVSGRGNHGYIQGQTATTTALGKLGQALILDGSDDYISVSNESQFDFERTDPFSISLWFKFSNNSTNGTLFAKQLNGGNFPGINFYIDGTNRRAYFILVSVDGGGNSLNVSTSMNSLNRDTWTHVIMTYDGSSSATGVKIYFNGVSQSLTVGVNSLTSSILNNTSPTFGRNLSSAGSTLKGSIDDARVYNRELSENEVKSIHKGGTLRTGVSRSADALSNGLVGHWTFDGSKMVSNVADSSGNNVHGYLQGQVSTTTTTGKIGQALRLSGANAFVAVGNSDTLNAPSAVTVSAWVKSGYNFGAVSSAMFGMVSRMDDASPFNGYELGIGGNYVSANNKAYFHAGGTYLSNVLIGTTIINDDVWHHLVGKYDGTKSYVYVDGVLQNEGVKTNNLNNPGELFDIGQNYDRVHDFRGSLDDIRVYNRALSDSEIKSLYNLGAGTKTNTSLSQKNVNSSGLVGHWTFDGSKMTSNVADSSGNGNHGYLQGQISTTTKIGKIGQSIQFDGIDDRVNVPDSSQFTISGPFAVSAWIKMNNASGFRLVSKATIAATQAEWGMGTSGAGSAYYFQLYSGGSAANNCSANVTSAATGDVNTWVHLLVQYSGSGGCGGISIYRNGEIQSVTTVNSGSGFSSFSNTSAPVNIGALFNDDPTYKSYARGLIDDVRIFNRTLSSTEIRQLYLLGN